ncbi:MAG: FAD-dependent oxidoreductase [Alphaproteobacteria bacterium]
MNRKNEKTDFDVVVVGGGIAGLALALLLGQAGLDIGLIEKYPPAALRETKPSARTIALMNSSLNIIKATGVWKNIAHYSNPMKTMRIMDASVPGKPVIDEPFTAKDLDLPQFGFNIPNSILRAALYGETQKNSAITCFVPHEFAAFETGDYEIKINLDNDTVLNATLLVGADGRKSAVREAAGIDAKHHEYGQSAITCIISHEKPHEDAATEFHRPGGPFALVPLPDNRSAVVWVEKTERADALVKLKKDDFTAALQKETHNILGDVTLESNPESWSLSSLKAEKLTAPRIALMAEAAHVMSPITAQGLNLSLRDVAALAEIVMAAIRLGLDPGSAAVLAQYERRRALDIDTRTFGVDAMNRIVSQETLWIKNIRRTGLNAVSALIPVRKFAMRAGLAPQIDLGRLTKGEKL